MKFMKNLKKKKKKIFLFFQRYNNMLSFSEGLNDITVILGRVLVEITTLSFGANRICLIKEKLKNRMQKTKKTRQKFNFLICNYIVFQREKNSYNYWKMQLEHHSLLLLSFEVHFYVQLVLQDENDRLF